MAERFSRRKLLVRRKLFLTLTKYDSHFLGVCYMIYTMLGFFGIDAVEFGYLAHMAIFPWIHCYSASWAMEFCYVHRLPLYYILVDELVLILDAYYPIPIEDYNLFLIHLLFIGLLILGYSYYYYKIIL